MGTEFIVLGVLPVDLLGYQVSNLLQSDQNCIIYILGMIERFSFECRKVIGFAFATLHD